MQIRSILLFAIILGAAACGRTDGVLADMSSGQLILNDGDGHRWVSRSMSAIYPEEIEGAYLSATWSEAEVKFVLEEAAELMPQLDGSLISGLELHRGKKLVGRALVVESRSAAAQRQEQGNRHSFDDFIAAVFYRNDDGLPGATEHCRPASEIEAEVGGCIWFTP